jgi:DNA-binding MarR family transcriptional regulator
MQTIIDATLLRSLMENPRSVHLGDMYQRPGFLLRRAHQISAAVFENACASVALTQAQYGALMVLAHEPKIDQSRLARALAFDKVTVLRVLRGLQERGLIQRSVSASDKRQMEVKLTAAGRRLLEKSQALAHDAYEQLMSPLSLAQRAQLIELLQALNGGLCEKAKAPFLPLS